MAVAAAAAAGGSLRGGSNGNNASRSSSSTSTCARLAPGGPVITVSPAHTLDYDCTDCGSFLFGHRGRLRPRPHGAPRTNVGSSSHHHTQQRNSLSEPPQAHAQRLLVVGSTTPVHHPFASHMNILPQNELLLSSYAQVAADVTEDATAVDDYTNHAIGLFHDLSDPVSLQASDEEVEEAAKSRVVDFVACHGAAPALAADNVNDSASTLAEIFRCFICLGKVVDAQLCPCCSKLVCQPCIKRWLTDQKSECPHCRAPLLVSQLVSCRFISEISLEVEKIQGKMGNSPMEKYCPAHDSPLLYFCTTCSVAVCSDCAVLIEDHRNHTFEKLSVAYGRHKKKIRMEAARLRRRRKELSGLVTSVDYNIETVLKSKDESAAELQMAFKRMQSRLEEQLKCKLLALLAQKGSMTQEMELLDTILHELDQQLNSIPKSDLIAQEPNMSRMLQDIRTRTFSEILRTPIPPEFTSEVVPSYEHGELILKNYKENLSETRPTVFTPGDDPNTNEVMSSKEVVYSEPIYASGVAWRLKVYPNGSGASQGTHLSVFLEMIEGGTEAATYEYGIELLHRSRPNQRIVRKFSSDFEAGACWGYYQFFRIDLLEKEGYLQPDEDTVTLRFYVRPLTYQQQCQDLRRTLAALQVERDESATQVAVIRRAFAATFFQRRRRRGSNNNSRTTAGHAATNDQQVASSPTRTLAVRKPPHMLTSSNNKHVQMLKMQEYGARAAAGNNKKSWPLPGMWAQAEEEEDQHPPQHHQHHHQRHPNLTSEATNGFHDFEAAAQILSPTHQDNNPAPHDDNPFLVRPTEDDDSDGAGTPSVEHLDTRRPKDEPWTKRGEEFLPFPKIRSHNKKVRSRKAAAHKLLHLAPDTFTGLLLPSRSSSTATSQQQQLAVEAGPSSKPLNHPTAAVALSSSSERANGDESPSPSPSPREKCDDNDGGVSYFDAEPDGQSCCTTAPVDVVEMRSVVEEREASTVEYSYYNTSVSGSSNNFCPPEIEDWGNLK